MIHNYALTPKQSKFFGAGLLLLPVAIIMLAFFLIPLLILGIQSLTGPTGFSLKHYIEIIIHPLYRSSLWNSIWLSVATALASLIICMPIAFYLAESNANTIKTWLRAGFLFPLSFPGIVVGFMIILLFGHTGLFPYLTNLVMGKTHLDIAFRLSGLFLAYMYFEIPRTTAILEGGVKQLDPKLEEAARSLGAGAWLTFYKITLPRLYPAILSTVTLCFATAMGAFGTALTLARDFSVLPIAMYSQYTLFFNIGLASAMAIVLAIFTLMALYVFQTVLLNEKEDN